MSVQKISSNYFMEQWLRYCVGMTGTTLPLNFMQQTGDTVSIGYICENDTEIECIDGRTIRLLTMTVPNTKEMYEWQ